MANIYFNDKLRRNLNAALFTRGYSTSGSQSTMDNQYSFRNWTSWPEADRFGTITLMKGEVPLDFSSLTLTTSRSTDILVTWTTNQSGFTFSEPTTNITGIAEISSAYSTASQSGIASWFRWYIAYSASDIFIQLCGTVGTSGADLVIGDTTIISGANYRFQNLKFDIPTEYTY